MTFSRVSRPPPPRARAPAPPLSIGINDQTATPVSTTSWQPSHRLHVWAGPFTTATGELEGIAEAAPTGFEWGCAMITIKCQTGDDVVVDADSLVGAELHPANAQRSAEAANRHPLRIRAGDAAEGPFHPALHA